MKTSLVWTRRDVLAALAGAAAGAALLVAGPRRGLAYSNLRPERDGSVKRFTFAQLRYAGGDWDPYPSAAAVFVREIERMTSVDPEPERRAVALGDPALFSLPFLYACGRDACAPFATEELARLRSWLEAGGTLVVDDAAATPGHGFDGSLRRELARALPEAAPERLPADHTVFKSFFIVRAVTGARVASPFLEGLTLQGRTAVIFVPNDLLGAFARDPLGRWLEPCAPGGERQRRMAFHLGVNIVMYALCGDYKQDRIHLPFLRQRT